MREEFEMQCFSIVFKSSSVDLYSSCRDTIRKWLVYLNTVLISRDGYAAVPHIGHEKEGPIPGFTDNGKLYQSIPSSCDLNRANSSFDLSCRLSEIWTSDILPQFDMFWDYKNARPKDF